ncbi:nicotinate phosphoribosyltransferase [Spiroplasma sp. DGKH1]|uniref:nicotinate phosphoribosyltransferase n=1 Tax=Spiroplasma sp. DGKH1 TaxID=3050074 RepID=UPI0034C69D34
MCKSFNRNYDAIYVEKTCKILEQYRKTDLITMQFFQWDNGVTLAGIDECIQLLRANAQDPQSLEIYALKDGDIVNAFEPVLKIKGHYYQFGFLEGIIDGILARQSSIATNCADVIQAAKTKEVIYMNDRSDNWINQENDGYAAYIGGIRKFVTPAMITKISDPTVKVVGTMPHSLIQAFNGNLIDTLVAYQGVFPDENITALVDYNNDVINDSLQAARAFPNLYTVRVDTSKKLIDKYFLGKEEQFKGENIYGVNKHLIKALRQELDRHHFEKIKITVSFGFTAEKIREFEAEKVPVDFYGVGQILSKINLNFTGDSVMLNDCQQAKVGRTNIESGRLQKYLL